jgi:unconventional prefoldin RPB5 interactor 1
MEKRLRKAEDELLALDAKDQPLQEGGEFPMQEIMEELDEDGNIVSSSINTPGNQASELLDVLKKAGVRDIPDAEEPKTTASPAEATPEDAVSDPSSSMVAETQADSSSGQNASLALESNDISREDLDLKRPVSVVTPEDRQQPPVTDVDETAEDARLRREMLQYGIDEVGAIVAELEMDESGSEVSFDEDYDYDYDEEENEDEYGRSHTALPADYHQQMRELEAKLNARGLMNMGKDTQTFPEEVQQEIENPTVVDPDAESSSKEKKPKKRVAFADDLDIAPAPEPQAAAEKPLPPQDEPKVLADSIVERTSRPQESPRPTPSGSKKASRFKSARGAAPGTPASESVTSGATTANPSEVTESRIRKQANTAPSTAPPTLFPATPKQPKPFSTPITDITETEHKPYTPKPPQDRTLAEKVLERQVTPGAAKAPELDHYDEELHQKQIASEFFHMQNRMSGKSNSQSEEEQAILPPDPEEPPKRVSKFKASRMG